MGGENEISQLTEYVIVANYSTRPVEPYLSDEILAIWKRLRQRLRYAVLISRLSTARDRIINLDDRLKKDVLITNGAADGKR